MSVIHELDKFIELSKQLTEQNYGDMWGKLHAGELNELDQIFTYCGENYNLWGEKGDCRWQGQR